MIDMARTQAAQHGLAASAWVAKLIRDATITEASRRYDEYDRASSDAVDMAVWDAASTAEQDERLAGAEW